MGAEAVGEIAGGGCDKRNLDGDDSHHEADLEDGKTKRELHEEGKQEGDAGGCDAGECGNCNVECEWATAEEFEVEHGMGDAAFGVEKGHETDGAGGK